MPKNLKSTLEGRAIQEGTEAKELINSYPHSAENYPRAVEALIDRYGRDDLQLQFYVRELLTLVISNVTNKEKLPMSTLYLRLESHLRCLATLKLDQADPATWLFPLVESSLGEETLRAWQRPQHKKANDVNQAQQSQQDPPSHAMNYAYGYSGYQQPPTHPPPPCSYTDIAKSASSANQCSSDVLLNTILVKLQVSGGGDLAARFRSSSSPAPHFSPEVKVPTPSESVQEVKSKRGRSLKKPSRYGQYFNLCV
ncbi:unnamed protein product [Orchesella dallaii]|uniref:Uncharacterized protein n=1 Tax=Orchesella dallaii TaxID=48710 RepID=A0ABP1S1Y8_9HEXA